MPDQKIASFLKQLRKTSGFSANEVVTNLKKYNIEISAKTLYGYESGLSMPNADVFVTLCKIYKCDNPMDIFGEISFSSIEISMVEKYRLLDSHGQETVSYILDRELKRTEQLEKSTKTQQQNTRIIQYFQKLASAGTGQVIFGDVPVERIEIPDIPEYKRASYAIGVNGDSMEPLYYDGDILLIEPTCEISVGEIGIFIVGNEAYVKKLGKTELISLNKGYDNIPLTEDSKCMGRVVGKI